MRSVTSALQRWKVSWLLVAGLFAGAFFLPQEIPLEWYPLNEPGDDINYLEIKCAADKEGWVQIDYDITHGFNDRDTIRFPIAPTKETYTYTFPLPDAPMTELVLRPVAEGAKLTVDVCRIINRREEEISRFDATTIVPLEQIASVTPQGNGFAITTQTGARANEGMAEMRLCGPIIPVGMTERNLKRCLLSTGYLAGMLVIVMAAVLFAFWRPANWRELVQKLALLAALAIPLSAVGNRGLIRNTVRYARYEPPSRLEITLRTARPSFAELFTDTGRGFRADERIRRKLAPVTDFQTICFPLPREPLRALRLDPLPSGGETMEIAALRVVNPATATEVDLPLSSFEPRHDIASIEAEEDTVTVRTLDDARDPILVFTPQAVELVKRALSGPDA